MWKMNKKLIISWMIYLLVLSGSGKANVTKKRVCVIGAGPAGLASVKQLADKLDEFDPIVFEKTSGVGGLWRYSDNTDLDQFGLPIHSSMYSNLRTNVPTDVMAFPDYNNFTDGDRSCARHKVVLQYLQNFTNDFNLQQYIQFNTLVEKVTPIHDKNGTRFHWDVSIRNEKSNESKIVYCDAVMVCNGHFFKPYIPKIPGMGSFPGRVIHSHLYRRPEEFKGQTVVLLGAGTSGPDLAVDISSYAKRVYLSHRHAKVLGKIPSNVIQVAGVISVSSSELTLQDASKITADVFIFCTGYLKDYPFLDVHSGVMVMNRGKDVGPLYKYVVNIEYTSMGFLGVVPMSILSLPQYYLQAQYYVAVLQGKVKLPSRRKMLEDIENMKSMPRNIFNFEWACYNELVKSGHVKPLPDYYEPATKLWLRHLYNEHFYFKDYNLRIFNNGTLEIYKL